MIKNYKLAFVGLIVSCSLLNAMDNQPIYAPISISDVIEIQPPKNFKEVLRIENLARELACTCIAKKKYPFGHVDNTTGSTLIKIFEIADGSSNCSRKIRDIILANHCTCMKDKEGNFDPSKITFKINKDDPNGAQVLNKISGLMYKNVECTVPILKRFNIHPDTVMPRSIFYHKHRITSGGKNYCVGSSSEYASIFGHFVKYATLDNSTKIDRMKDIFRDLLDLGGHINKRKNKQKIYEKKCFSKFTNYDAEITGTDDGYIVNTEYVMSDLNTKIRYNEEQFHPREVLKKRPYVKQRKRLYGLMTFYNTICDTNDELKKVKKLSK